MGFEPGAEADKEWKVPRIQWAMAASTAFNVLYIKAPFNIWTFQMQKLFE